MTQPSTSASPEAILDIAIGFMGAKQLFAASRVGLFSALANGPLSLDELTTATSVPAQQLRILADSMAAQGLLTRTDGSYALTPDAAAYLTADGAGIDLTAFLSFLNDVSYKQWLRYDQTVDSGEAGTLELDADGWGGFMAGVMTYNELHAEQLAAHFDFSRYRNALDFGGLSPAFAVNGMKANPELNTRFVFAPDFTESVKQAVEAAGVADRTTVEGGDTATVEPGGEHDLILVNHVIHRFDDAQNRVIFANARAAAATGAHLVVLDFFLDDNPVQRKIDALHAGEYFNIDGTVVYPESTVAEWLTATGWKPVETVALPGSPRILVAEAV